MLTVSREMALTHLLEISRVVGPDADASVDVVTRVLDWLVGTQATLRQLKHPAAGTVAVQFGLIEAMASQAQGRESRRAVRVLAVEAVREVQRELRKIVDDADTELAALREKVVQLLAVARSSGSLELPQGPLSEAIVTSVLGQLRGSNGVQVLYDLVVASAAPTDVTATVRDAIENMRGNPVASPTGE